MNKSMLGTCGSTLDSDVSTGDFSLLLCFCTCVGIVMFDSSIQVYFEHCPDLLSSLLSLLSSLIY